MNPRSGLDTGTPAAATVPRYTYAGTLSELETLGVNFQGDTISGAALTALIIKGETTPYAVKLLAMHDQEMLHRIMTAIRNTDEPARIIWEETLGRINTTDMTKHGKIIAVNELARIMPQLERLLAINPIDAALMNNGQKESHYRPFWNLNHSTYLEKKTGLTPGDDDYKLVQAHLIHVNITQPKKYDNDAVQLYLQTNHDDIAFIAEHLDETLRLLPELYVRKDASRDAIETLLNVKPVLAEGAL